MSDRTPGMAAFQKWQELCHPTWGPPTWSRLSICEKSEWEEVASAAIAQSQQTYRGVELAHTVQCPECLALEGHRCHAAFLGDDDNMPGPHEARVRKANRA